MSDVIDLSDLVKAVKFKFNNEEFEIPPIPDDKLKEIMAIANKITKSGENEEDKDSDLFIEHHNKFLSLSVQRKDEQNVYHKMEPNDFASWPLKLKNRVMELVFEQVGTSTGDAIPVDSEKN
jgi:hypothetical protein